MMSNFAFVQYFASKHLIFQEVQQGEQVKQAGIFLTLNVNKGGRVTMHYMLLVYVVPKVGELSKTNTKNTIQNTKYTNPNTKYTNPNTG